MFPSGKVTHETQILKDAAIPATEPLKVDDAGWGTRKCPKCGAKNGMSRQQCESCGAKLPATPKDAKPREEETKHAAELIRKYGNAYAALKSSSASFWSPNLIREIKRLGREAEPGPANVKAEQERLKKSQKK